MPMLKNTEQNYGRVAVGFHWVSALLILMMLPLGFLMQKASEAEKIQWYRIHILIGILILLITLARIAWKFFNVKPEPAPGLRGIHLLGMKLIHILLYLVLFLLPVSGIVLMVQSGMVDVLRGVTQDLPKFDGMDARQAHGLLSRCFIGLLIAHIGGVILHQIRFGHVFPRMGIGKTKLEK